jgi:hypothetical protein
MKTAETVGHYSVGFRPDHLVGRQTLPEVDSAHLEELAGLAAEQTDQGGDVGSLRSGGGKAQEQLLEGFVGARIGTLDERRVSRVHVRKAPPALLGYLSKYLNIRGKYRAISF